MEKVSNLLESTIRKIADPYLKSGRKETATMSTSIRKCLFRWRTGYPLPPATKEIAKMLPLVDRPIIAYGVEEALSAGCREMVMITGRTKSQLKTTSTVLLSLKKC